MPKILQRVGVVFKNYCYANQEQKSDYQSKSW